MQQTKNTPPFAVVQFMSVHAYSYVIEHSSSRGMPFIYSAKQRWIDLCKILWSTGETRSAITQQRLCHVVQKNWGQPRWLKWSCAAFPSPCFLRGSQWGVWWRGSICLESVSPLSTHCEGPAPEQTKNFHYAIFTQITPAPLHAECVRLREGNRVKGEREILYRSSRCFSLVCFLNKSNNDH